MKSSYSCTSTQTQSFMSHSSVVFSLSCRCRRRIENQHLLSDELDFEKSESLLSSKKQPQVQDTDTLLPTNPVHSINAGILAVFPIFCLHLNHDMSNKDRYSINTKDYILKSTFDFCFLLSRPPLPPPQCLRSPSEVTCQSVTLLLRLHLFVFWWTAAASVAGWSW